MQRTLENSDSRFKLFRMIGVEKINILIEFQENDLIQLIQRVDDNWYEGRVNGKTGYFPQSYVEIKVPFPN